MSRELPDSIECHLPLNLNCSLEEEDALRRGGALPAPLPTQNPTKSFWTHGEPDCNPLAREGSDGDLTLDADVCIVGSGMTGVSCAYHLAQLARQSGSLGKLKVVILEARDFCSGATGRNGGHLTNQLWHRMDELVKTYGAEEALKARLIEYRTVTSIVDFVKANNWESAVDLVEGGHISLVFSKEELDATERDIKAAEVAGTPDLDKIEWEYGTKHPGYRVPGYNIWPLKLVTKLFEVARGPVDTPSLIQTMLPSFLYPKTPQVPFELILHTHTPVLSVSPTEGSGTSSGPARRWAIETQRGTLKASHVVHATNAYASHLLSHLSGPSGIIPIRGQIYATRAVVPKRELWNVGWRGNDGFEYWFSRPCAPDEKPLILLGGGRESTGPDFERNVTDDSRLNPSVSKTLRSFLPAAFPTQFSVKYEPEMEWSGVMGYTVSRDPMVGQVTRPDSDTAGEYIAAGYTGHGMPRAFSCAEAVAQMIVADIRKEAWKPPHWLPSWYLTTASLTKLDSSQA